MMTSILGAAVVGALLALSGAVLQSVFRNPLAEPYILGMVGGAALFASAAAMCGLTALGCLVLPAVSFLGACCSLALVALVAYLVARSRRVNGGDSVFRASYSSVILSGFVVTGFTGSLQMLLVSYADPEAVKAIQTWIFGTVDGISGVAVFAGACLLAVVGGVLCAFRRALNVMELGHDEAACLGVNVRLTLAVVLGTVALATAASVALAGMIGFVGLVVPHLARRLAGPRMQWLLPFSAAFGAAFLALAQVVCLLLPEGRGYRPGVGVVCAILCAPFMLTLLVADPKGEGRDV